MATVSVDLFLPEIRQNALGCPEPVARQALIDTLKEFCDRTSCWRERLPAVTLSSGDFPYLVTPPAHGELLRFVTVYGGPSRLRPINMDMLDGVAEWDTKIGDPTHFTVEDDGALIVYPKPPNPLDVRATVVYTVADGTNLVEAFLYSRWKVDLARGALRTLVAMPDKPWSRPDMVNFYTQQFEQCVQAARAEMNSGNRMVTSLTVKMRRP